MKKIRNFFIFVNFDVPVQKKNMTKFQDGCHWEQNALRLLRTILLPVAAILEFFRIFFLNGDVKITISAKFWKFFCKIERSVNFFKFCCK